MVRKMVCCAVLHHIHPLGNGNVMMVQPTPAGHNRHNSLRE
jgi:hypothetical protein